MRKNLMAIRLGIALESAQQNEENDVIKLKKYGNEETDPALEQRTVALESYVTALHASQEQPEIAQLMGISTEGFMGKLVDSAKEAVAQWTVGFRRWKAGSWDKMSHEDKVRAIKNANFTFFYHNPKYIKNVKSVYDLAETLALNIIEGISKPNLETAEKKLISEFELLLKALGHRPTSKEVDKLVGQFKEALKSYVPPAGSVGDDDKVVELVEFIDKAKFGVQYDIDELQHALELAAEEASKGDTPVLDLINRIVKAIMLFGSFMIFFGMALILSKK